MTPSISPLARRDPAVGCARRPATADRAGRLIAILCALHCAAPPLLLAVVGGAGVAGPLGEQVERLEALEGWLVATAAVVVAASAWAHRHCLTRTSRLGWFALGLGLLVVGRPLADALGITEWIVGLAAGGALFAGHADRASAQLTAC